MAINLLSKIKSNYISYLAKGTGIAALGLIARDAHVIGKIQADTFSQSCDADAVEKRFNNTLFLSNPSVTTQKMKKTVFRWEVENNFRNFFNSGIGYFKGLGSMLVNDVVPLTLGLGALFGKGKWSKGSALGLGAYALISFFKDGLGMGHNDLLNKKF